MKRLVRGWSEGRRLSDKDNELRNKRKGKPKMAGLEALAGSET